jgi:hypothetical protein
LGISGEILYFIPTKPQFRTSQLNKASVPKHLSNTRNHKGWLGGEKWGIPFLLFIDVAQKLLIISFLPF